MSSFPEPPPAARATPSPHRIGAAGFLVGTAAVVTVIGLLAALVTWRFHPGPKPPCVANCGPPVQSPLAASATPLTESHAYRSSRLGFELEYPTPPWTATQRGAESVVLEAAHGEVAFRVEGARAGASPVQLVLDAARSLGSSSLPDITPDHVIRGARVGTVSGVGEVLSATYVPGSGGGQAQAVRIPIIAARQNGLSVVALGLAPYDRGVPGGVFAGNYLDYLLTEFGWPGG